MLRREFACKLTPEHVINSNKHRPGTCSWDELASHLHMLAYSEIPGRDGDARGLLSCHLKHQGTTRTPSNITAACSKKRHFGLTKDCHPASRKRSSSFSRGKHCPTTAAHWLPACYVLLLSLKAACRLCHMRRASAAKDGPLRKAMRGWNEAGSTRSRMRSTVSSVSFRMPLVQDTSTCARRHGTLSYAPSALPRQRWGRGKVRQGSMCLFLGTAPVHEQMLGLPALWHSGCNRASRARFEHRYVQHFVALR